MDYKIHKLKLMLQVLSITLGANLLFGGLYEKDRYTPLNKGRNPPSSKNIGITNSSGLDRHGVIVPTVRSGGRGSTDGKHTWDLISNGKRIRRLTPKECWRLQGMPDTAFDKAKDDGVSDTQLYKQAGNGVTVNVVQTIADKLEVLQ